jgi:BirA family transcriptional regulator, biotin operon repressor / biotin---[acetyl-CoA-carboxylase] ligase
MCRVDTELIRLLSHGEFHSGESLGRSLGISRAAVWKRIERLNDYGMEVERLRGKGYRLPGGLDLLDEGRLRAALADRMGIDVLMSTGSTNADALKVLGEGRPLPFAILAEHQRAGRGRRGRVWQSPFAGNLYLTLAWRFPVGAPQLEGLSLAVGVVVADVLNEAGLTPQAGLKWPNDIWVSGRKIGGVLIELSGDLEEGCTAIIGVGVNLRMPAGAGGDIDQPWTCFSREMGAVPDRNAMAIDVLQRLDEMMRGFARGGFGQWHTRWAALDALYGQQVSVTTSAGPIDGVAEGVDERGALRVCVAGKHSVFHGGEVSLRPIQAAPGKDLP